MDVTMGPRAQHVKAPPHHHHPLIHRGSHSVSFCGPFASLCGHFKSLYSSFTDFTMTNIKSLHVKTLVQGHPYHFTRCACALSNRPMAVTVCVELYSGEILHFIFWLKANQIWMQSVQLWTLNFVLNNNDMVLRIPFVYSFHEAKLSSAAIYGLGTLLLTYWIIEWTEVMCPAQWYLDQTHWSCETLWFETIPIHKFTSLFTTFTVVAHKHTYFTCLLL